MASIVAAAEAEIAGLAAELEALQAAIPEMEARYSRLDAEWSLELDALRESTTLEKYFYCPVIKVAKTAINEKFNLDSLRENISQSTEKAKQLQANIEYCRGNLPSLQQLAATIAEAKATLSPTEAELAIAEAKLAQIVGETTALDSLIEKLEKDRKSTDEVLKVQIEAPGGWQSTSDELRKIEFKLEFAKEKRAELQPRLTFLQVDRVIKRVKCEL
jgi:chromosome segregation ATPase